MCDDPKTRAFRECRELAWALMVKHRGIVGDALVLSIAEVDSMNQSWTDWRNDAAQAGLTSEQQECAKMKAREMLVACPLLPERQE